jgi:hypothetical protein
MNITRFVAALLSLSAASWATTVHVAADTYIIDTSPSQNYGAATTLNVAKGSAALIGLDLSPLPAGLTSANIARATLTVFVNKVFSTGYADISYLTASWDESVVSYSTRPTVGGLVQHAVPINASGAYVTFDITSVARQWVSGTICNCGVMIQPSADQPGLVANLDSKESTSTSHPAFAEITLTSTGPAGPPGASGPTGPQGPTGPAGSSATVTVQTVCSALGYADTQSCQLALSPTKLVFLTKVQHNGILGGLSAADQICQQEASDAGLQGTYKAWLSTESTSAASRLANYGNPLRLPNGALVANGISGLLVNGPRVPINIQADGSGPVTSSVWSGTNANGGSSLADCGGWVANGLGTYGRSDTTTALWSSVGPQSCTVAMRLYCLQQ